MNWELQIHESGFIPLASHPYNPLHLTPTNPQIIKPMNHFTYNTRSQFLVDTIHALHLKLDQFMYNLVHHSRYEIILYLWIHKLYDKQKTSEEAVQLIYKARNLFLLGKCGS
ncbi:hypothetical protein J8281_18000 [Aquimarina sp. U1-2]|uniref:hypothetical protein n=1 Tax=Aquimarina sp. U1-2 TaxID=2823141 RepID=UPI001AED035F|nr:hypothetical protein [Aquimarina sp. U1-2]MBP2834095.1 hypothetical protein [Aquimarina sp. U1-2]